MFSPCERFAPPLISESSKKRNISCCSERYLHVGAWTSLKREEFYTDYDFSNSLEFQLLGDQQYIGEIIRVQGEYYTVRFSLSTPTAHLLSVVKEVCKVFNNDNALICDESNHNGGGSSNAVPGLFTTDNEKLIPGFASEDSNESNVQTPQQEDCDYMIVTITVTKECLVPAHDCVELKDAEEYYRSRQRTYSLYAENTLDSKQTVSDAIVKLEKLTKRQRVKYESLKELMHGSDIGKDAVSAALYLRLADLFIVAERYSDAWEAVGCSLELSPGHPQGYVLTAKIALLCSDNYLNSVLSCEDSALVRHFVSPSGSKLVRKPIRNYEFAYQVLSLGYRMCSLISNEWFELLDYVILLRVWEKISKKSSYNEKICIKPDNLSRLFLEEEDGARIVSMMNLSNVIFPHACRVVSTTAIPNNQAVLAREEPLVLLPFFPWKTENELLPPALASIGIRPSICDVDEKGDGVEAVRMRYCNCCGNHFVTVSDLRHMFDVICSKNLCHNGNSKLLEEKILNEWIPKNRNTSTPVSCSVCRKGFCSVACLKKAHRKYHVLECPSESSSTQQETNQNSFSAPEFACEPVDLQNSRESVRLAPLRHLFSPTASKILSAVVRWGEFVRNLFSLSFWNSIQKSNMPFRDSIMRSEHVQQLFPEDQELVAIVAREFSSCENRLKTRIWAYYFMCVKKAAFFRLIEHFVLWFTAVDDVKIMWNVGAAHDNTDIFTDKIPMGILRISDALRCCQEFSLVKLESLCTTHDSGTVPTRLITKITETPLRNCRDAEERKKLYSRVILNSTGITFNFNKSGMGQPSTLADHESGSSLPSKLPDELDRYLGKSGLKYNACPADLKEFCREVARFDYTTLMNNQNLAEPCSTPLTFGEDQRLRYTPASASNPCADRNGNLSALLQGSILCCYKSLSTIFSFLESDAVLNALWNWISRSNVVTSNVGNNIAKRLGLETLCLEFSVAQIPDASFFTIFPRFSSCGRQFSGDLFTKVGQVGSDSLFSINSVSGGNILSVSSEVGSNDPAHTIETLSTDLLDVGNCIVTPMDTTVSEVKTEFTLVSKGMIEKGSELVLGLGYTS